MLNSKIKKHIIQLKQKKYRKEYKEFLLEGLKGIRDAIDADAEIIVIVVDGSRRDEIEFQDLVAYAKKHNIAVEYCGREDISLIKSTETFPGILAVIAQDESYVEDIENGPVLYLHDINDPGNMGTIIRSADWFGIKHILLSQHCVDIYNPKVVRSTMGSLFHVYIHRIQNVFKNIEQMKEKGFHIVALDMNGKDISDAQTTKKTLYIIGSESHGVPDELEKLIDTRYTIAGKGNAESLNVAVATAILLYTIS